MLRFDQFLCFCEMVVGILHKCMGEAHFGSIDDAIPYAFYQCKDIVVLGIEHNLLQRRLFKSVHTGRVVSRASIPPAPVICPSCLTRK